MLPVLSVKSDVLRTVATRQRHDGGGVLPAALCLDAVGAFSHAQKWGKTGNYVLVHRQQTVQIRVGPLGDILLDCVDDTCLLHVLPTVLHLPGHDTTVERTIHYPCARLPATTSNDHRPVSDEYLAVLRLFRALYVVAVVLCFGSFLILVCPEA